MTLAMGPLHFSITWQPRDGDVLQPSRPEVDSVEQAFRRGRITREVETERARWSDHYRLSVGR